MKRSMGVVAIMTVLSALSMQSVSADASAEMFGKLDTNADGYISVQEAEAHADLPDAFAEGDMNNDGRLDQAEFAKLEISDE